MKSLSITVWRLPFLLLAILSLIVGLWTGLSRIGWDIFILPATAHHGAVMVGGFLGSLIALEKVIPLRTKWLFIIPCLSIAAVIMFLLGEMRAAIFLLVLASVGLTGLFGFYWYKQRSVIYALMLVGALCLFIGNVLLYNALFYPLALPWWVAFILFVIAAERIELMKFLPVTARSKNFFIVLLLTFIAGAAVSFHHYGNIIAGASLFATALWLLSNDAISVGLKKQGLTKFVSTSLLLGYLALLTTGIFFITFSDHWLAYDALVHTFFIGFAFSMIFAHGPIILPGVLGISAKPYHHVLYIWLLLLHCSWLLRVFSDAFTAMEWRRYSAIFTTIAIVGYFLSIALLTIQNEHGKTR